MVPHHYCYDTTISCHSHAIRNTITTQQCSPSSDDTPYERCQSRNDSSSESWRYARDATRLVEAKANIYRCWRQYGTDDSEPIRSTPSDIGTIFWCQKNVYSPCHAAQAKRAGGVARFDCARSLFCFARFGDSVDQFTDFGKGTS